MKTDFDFATGEVLLIDKPYEWTSFGVVKKVRYNVKVKKVGHAGTLDPLATGLLIICTGKKTKTINDFMAMEKEYEGTLLLGKTTPSVDLETEFDSDSDFSFVTKELVNGLIPSFSGEIQQVPPIFSAIKVKGERVYNKARKGEDIKLEPRTVVIHELEFTKFDFPEIEFRVKCSKGTYIRSLVRDIGEKLGCGACMTSLRRTKIGDFSVEDAYQLENFIELVQQK